MIARLTIRTRLILLTCAGLFVLVATNVYLTKKLAENSAGMVTAADLLNSIEEANNARIAFQFPEPLSICSPLNTECRFGWWFPNTNNQPPCLHPHRPVECH